MQPTSDTTPLPGWRTAFTVLNVAGGVAVLGSYALWLGNPSNHSGALWGSIDGAGRLLYAVSMCAAAAGYFAFFAYLLRYVPTPGMADPFPAITTIFALILFPSALWMPLSFEYLDAPTVGLWWAIRGTLWVVGSASLMLALLLRRLPPRQPTRAHAWAVAGALAFTFQTGVLDAFVWPLCFPG